ncbi:ATP-grasp domain-containing protein [Rathayibacter sp. CAU 1779]
MSRRAVLLSESSSLTAREFVTVLGARRVRVEAVCWSALPIARFSRWCARVHEVPAPGADPVGYLRAVDRLMSTGRFDALLPTHEQSWLFAVGRALIPHAAVMVADAAGFDRLQSKISFARTIDALGLRQPEWRQVHGADDLGLLGYPVWVKAAVSTAGRGVRLARSRAEAERCLAEFAPLGEVMIQRGTPGRYRQVQGVFDHGRPLGVAVSEQLAVGVGGSAAARLSVRDDAAVDALSRVGSALNWHGGLDLDYFDVGGEPVFIECNPRITEPGNVAAAGVDLPGLLLAGATGDDLPDARVLTRPGVRTRSTMAVALGAAERQATRRAVVAALFRSVTRRPPLTATTEVLTPVLRDPPSIVPFAVATASVLVRPGAVARLSSGAVGSYSVTPDAIAAVREAL